MNIEVIRQIDRFLKEVGQEIWENGEVSPSQKAILKSISLSQLRNYKEQGGQWC